MFRVSLVIVQYLLEIPECDINIQVDVVYRSICDVSSDVSMTYLKYLVFQVTNMEPKV